MTDTKIVLQQILEELKEWPVSEYHNQHFSPHYLVGLSNVELIILRKLVEITNEPVILHKLAEITNESNNTPLPPQ